MTFPEQYPGGAQWLANEIARLGRELDALRSRSLRIPVVDADPPVEDPANIWMFADGRLRTRMPDGSVKNFVHSEDADSWPNIPVVSSDPAGSTGIDIWVRASDGHLSVRTPSSIQRYAPTVAGAVSTSTSTAPPPSSDVPKPVEVPRQTYEKVYNSVWSQSYHQSGGGQRTDTADLYYGRIESYHAENRSMVGFDYALIAADLAGSDVAKVEVYLNNKHAYFNSGVDISLGTHEQAAKPGTYSANRVNVSAPHYGKPEAAWRTISENFGVWLRDGSAKGLVLDQPSTSASLYGYAAPGVSLRITYIK